ncbi:hypothetical protein EJ06DRAFT_44487 [Trichodelitschia bisporula]|uniref:Flavin reductase like domain-containing protein n=1 Tax=Trichodelitschia bisporula TaxID=703511 RepID=A0A6G1HVU2_9PEZI|nr:hypothetical protein EJ06DRAFT_44487 [Trichodelitschia bisporula]
MAAAEAFSVFRSWNRALCRSPMPFWSAPHNLLGPRCSKRLLRYNAPLPSQAVMRQHIRSSSHFAERRTSPWTGAGAWAAGNKGQRRRNHTDASESPRLGREAETNLNRLRSLMRCMPHPVVLITTCAETATPSEAERKERIPHHERAYGAIVSSFTTVTLGPPPVVSFNLRVPSRTLNGISHNQLFTVHLLKATGHGAGIADLFVKHGHPKAFELLPESEHSLDLPSVAGDASDGTAFYPLIAGKGIMGSIVCRLLPSKCVTVDDHIIMVAEVLEVSSPGSHHRGLLYSDGRYKTHGDPLEP